MFAALARDFRLAPITFLMLAASVVLFFAVELHRTQNDDPLGGRRTLGAVDGLAFVGEDEVHGPFDLWDGPWWRWVRIPISAFHHGSLLHLFFNVSTLWFLGPLLERRLRRVTYVGFWFFAAVVPFVPEFLLEHYAIGLSGVACAMFGWCLVERHFDAAVASRMHEGAVRGFWTCLIVCVVATAMGLINIANVAHFVGVAYGWLMARAARARLGRWLWIAGHLAVPLAIYGVLHPVWNGRYHAFLGRQAAQRDGSLTAGVPHFREAVRRDPSLSRVWLSLAAERQRQLDVLAAWRLLVEGLQHNRSSELLEDSARKLWRWLPSQDREEALQCLKNQFADEAGTWEKRLQVAAAPLDEIKSPSPSSDSPLGPPEVGELVPREEDSPRTGRRVRPRKAPAIDPDKADSASEGRTL